MSEPTLHILASRPPPVVDFSAQANIDDSDVELLVENVDTEMARRVLWNSRHKRSRCWNSARGGLITLKHGIGLCSSQNRTMTSTRVS